MNKNLIILLSIQLLFQLGLWIGLIGNLHFLQQNVSSYFLQSFILVLGSVFSVLISPYAGKIVDGVSPKKILFVVGIVRVISVGAMFIALYMDSVWWMIIYSLGVSCSAAFFEPTLQTLIVEITEENDLLIANSLNLNIITLSRIFGAALGGVILTFTSLNFLYLIILITFLIVTCGPLFMNINNENVLVNKEKEKVVFRELFPIISKRFNVKMILFLSIIPIIFIAGFNLFIVQISLFLNSNSIKGILYVFEGAALILASSFITPLFRRKKNISVLLYSSFLIALVPLLLSFSSSYFLFLISFSVFGLAYGIFNPIAITFNQENVPKEFHGRFFAFKGMLERTIMQIAMVIIGLSLDIWGFSNVTLMISLSSLSIILLFMLLIFLKKRTKDINKSVNND